MKKLVGKSGPLEGSAYAIAGSTLIGRDAECDIQLLEPLVSRMHCCVLEQDDGSVLLRDLVSHNGTFVGDKRVTEAILQPGDVIAIGESRFELVITAGDEDATRTQEIDLKLVSGPAQDPTQTLTWSEQDRAELIARAKLEKARASEAAKTAPFCCDSPLAAQARAQRWKFCPACGKAPLG